MNFLASQRARGHSILLFVLLLGILPCATGSLALAQDKAASAVGGSDAARQTKPLREIEPAPLPAQALVTPPADGVTVQQACDEARQILEDGRPDAALKRLEGVLSDETVKSCDAFTLAGETELTRERTKEARDWMDKALALKPADVNANYLLALIELQEQHPEPAIARLRRATLGAEDEINNPRVTLAWLQLGQTLAKSGYALAAAQALERFDRDIWEIFPERRNHPQIALYLAQYPLGALSQRLELLAQAGRNEERGRAVNAALERWGEQSEIRRLAVTTLLESGKPADAFAVIRDHLSEAGYGGVGLALAAKAAQAAGKLDALLQAAGSNAEQMRRVAATLNHAGNFAAAREAARAALKNQPDNSGAALELGRALFQSGDAPAALAELARFARANSSKTTWTGRDLGIWIQKDDDQLPLKKALYARESAGDRDFADNFVLGIAAAALNDERRAETLLQAASIAQPDFVAANAARADLYNAHYAWQKAREFVEPLVKARPDAAALQYQLGVALDGLDDNDAAEKAFKAAIRLSPSQNAYCIALAQHDLRLGEYAGAIRFFQQAYDNDASDAVALEGLFDSCIRGEKLELARNLFEKVNAADLPEDSLRRMRTTMRFQKNLFTQAHLNELDEQFQRHPEDVRTGLVLAAGLFITDHLPEARARLARVLATAPEDQNAQVLSARLSLAEADFGAAADVLERSLGRFPQREELLILHSQAALYDFRMDEARTDLARLAARRPDVQGKLRDEILKSHTNLGDYSGALQQLDAWIAAGLEVERLTSLKINVLCEAGKADEALQMAQARLDAKPEDPLRRSDFAAAAQAAKAFEIGESKLRAWLQAEPQQQQYFNDLEDLLISAQKGDALLELVDSLSATANPLARHYTRGVCLQRLQRTDDAVAEFDELLKSRTLQVTLVPEIRERIVRTLIIGGKFDLALERCEKWLRAAEGRDEAAWRDALHFKYMALSGAERLVDAAQVAEKLLEYPRERRDPDLNNDLGYTWADMGINLDRALEMLRLAVAEKPLEPMFLDSLGWVYYKRAEFPAALRQLERAVQLVKGRDGTIYDHLGDARWRSGKKDDAYAAWKLSAVKLREQLAERKTPRYEELLRNVEQKLATQSQDQKPRVAPTGAEQKTEKP